MMAGRNERSSESGSALVAVLCLVFMAGLLAGAVLAVYPGAVLLCLVVFAIVFGLTHYVSLGSMSAGVAFPIFILILKRQPPVSLVVFGCVIALLLLFTHRKNIRRLLTRCESKTYLFKHKG